MTTFGLTSTGFTLKPSEEIQSEIQADMIAALGANLNVTANSVAGQIIDIFSLKLAELWELEQAVYNAFDPDFATGDALDRLGLLTGTARLLATKSTVTATVNLNNGVTIPAGSTASVSGNSSAIFVTLVDVTNSSGITGNFSIAMAAQSTGPTVANAGTLTVIGTPVVGWNSITNASDATLGTNIETDAAYRLRRVLELTGIGTSPINSIRADLLNVTGVKSVFMFENQTDSTDGNGLPPHSFEALVYGGSDANVANEIWLTKAAGIAMNGTTSVVIVDSSGSNHTIKFTRPTVINIFIDAVLSINSSTYPSDGNTQVATDLAAYGQANLLGGTSVIATALYGPIFQVTGVNDVTSLYIYDNSSLGSESLAETDFTTHTKWTSTGDFAYSAGTFVYTDSTHVGTLTQTVANMAVGPTNSRFYAFTCTITSSTGSVSANITTSFASAATALNLVNGTNTVYVHSAVAASDFVISCTSTSGAFTIDNVSLKILNRPASGTNFAITSRQLAVLDTSRIFVSHS